MSFITELKRRNVFKVGIAYAIVAWLLAQILSVINTPLHLPNWFDTVVLVSLAIGFPIALIIAWAFEMTPEGVKPTRALVNDKKSKAILEAAPAKDQSSPRLAILPFENLSPDPDNAFFTDGLHEEILSTLTNRAPDLQVISRTTMMSYRRDPKPLAEIAGELKASHVLEGSVRREGDQVRLTLQLIDGVTDNHLWARKYDRTLSAALTLQSEVAEAVADQLAVQLAVGSEKAKPPTTDVIAYDFYLKANTAFFDGRFSAATRYLDQAIDRDPGFAQAYARRGFVYMAALNSGIGVIEDPAERNRAAQLAEENAQQAIALDPTLGLPHTVLAEVHVYHWRWGQTHPEYEQALVLSPNEPFSIVVLSYYLTFTGDSEDEERAWELAQRLVELDPRSTEIYVNKAYISLYLGKLDEAAANFRETLSLNPTVYEGIAYLGLGMAESRRGNTSAALDALHNGEQLMMNETTPAKTALLIYAYGSSGQPDEAQRLFQTFEALAANEFVCAMSWFIAYRGIGNKEQAIDWLHKAIDTHDTYGQIFRMMAKQRFFPDLWDNPRFQEARRKVGFTD